jgi:UDP-glucose:O-linked fucose beta-1,3-glucosyltransferase
LGERYGYDLFSDDGGYNYITGGGGIVFNLKTVRRIVESCTCPSPSSPDDMIIASCLRQFDIEPIHSSLFHQARPRDYPRSVLNRNSISFHKFWQIDPLEEYARWARKRDEEYFEINKHLIDYKYLNRECVSPAVASSFGENSRDSLNDVLSHAEL